MRSDGTGCTIKFRDELKKQDPSLAADSLENELHARASILVEDTLAVLGPVVIPPNGVRFIDDRWRSASGWLGNDLWRGSGRLRYRREDLRGKDG